MSDSDHVRTQAWTQVRPRTDRIEDTEEHREGLLGTLTVAANHKKEGNTTRRQGPAQPLGRRDSKDIGSLDSKRFLELVKYSSKNEESVKKTNKCQEDFKEALLAQVEELTSQANHQAAQSSSRDAEFSNSFRIAYFSVLRDNTTIQGDGDFKFNPDRSDQHLYLKYTETLSSAASLTERLQISLGKLEAQRSSFTVNADWQEDIHQMKHILDVGRQIGEQKVESILTGGGEPPLNAKTAEISQLLYNKHNRVATGLSWDGVAKRQEKVVMRLVNTLLWE